MIRLWYSPGACSLAARILLNEVGAAFEGVSTLVREKATFAPNFVRINPKRRVPVLGVDGEIITELPAVMTAISAMAPERGLMGRSTLETVRVYEWLNWLSGTVHGQGFGCLWRPERFSDDPSSHDAIRQKGRATIAESYDLIESRLSGPDAVADQFSAVDAFLIVLYRWGSIAGFDMSQYARFTDLVFRLLSRPSVEKSLIDEGIAIDGLQ